MPVVARTHSVPVLPPPPQPPPQPRPEFHMPSPVLRTLLMMVLRPSTRLHRYGGGGVASSDFCDCLVDCLEIRHCCCRCCSSRTRPRIRQTLSVCGRYSRSLTFCGSTLRCLRFPRSTGLAFRAWPSLGVGVCRRWRTSQLRVERGLEWASG